MKPADVAMHKKIKHLVKPAVYFDEPEILVNDSDSKLVIFSQSLVIHS